MDIISKLPFKISYIEDHSPKLDFLKYCDKISNIKDLISYLLKHTHLINDKETKQILYLDSFSIVQLCAYIFNKSTGPYHFKSNILNDPSDCYEDNNPCFTAFLITSSSPFIRYWLMYYGDAKIDLHNLDILGLIPEKGIVSKNITEWLAYLKNIYAKDIPITEWSIYVSFDQRMFKLDDITIRP